MPGRVSDLVAIWVPRECNTLADALSHPDRDHSGLHLTNSPGSLRHLIAPPRSSAQDTDQPHDETVPRQKQPYRSKPTRPGPKNTRRLSSLPTMLTLLPLLLFTVLRACEAESTSSLHNAKEARIEARVRVDALATSTSRGYIRAATRFIRTIPGAPQRYLTAPAPSPSSWKTSSSQEHGHPTTSAPTPPTSRQRWTG